MINQNHTYKIALIGDCLANGGAEKVHALLSVYFQKQGLEVHNCIFVDWISYDYSGSLFNLGIINTDANFIKRKITRFFAFKKFIKENDFDAIIDFRMRTGVVQELLISKFCYSRNTFYTVHSGILDYYFPKPSWISKLIYNNKKIIAVSKVIQKAISNKLSYQVNQLYNPIDLEAILQMQNKYEVLEENYILAAGRMNEDVKQFDELIIAYSKTILPAKKIKLILLGDGTNRSKYESLAAELDLKDLVIFKGFIENPFPYYQKALFTVLSSKNEGFPNVILESFAIGTPVISFDCFSGPNEIIKDKYNGLLVANQDFDKLTEAMNLFVENHQLYKHCKQNTVNSISQFDIKIIGKRWMDLVKNKVS
jgi:N-acetylgalactosamine-N,N'-diacetylbacillosaminyl-diphospho-undecaprenol 4-alpha-N-acetylgalactosaminyltransferase